VPAGAAAGDRYDAGQVAALDSERGAPPSSGAVRWAGSQLRARMWCADPPAPPRKAGASSAATRTTASRPDQARSGPYSGARIWA
jgi:hypothetical protein